MWNYYIFVFFFLKKYQLKIEKEKEKATMNILPKTSVGLCVQSHWNLIAMENSQNSNSNPNPNPIRIQNLVSSPIAVLWPTIDGSLGLSEEESVSYARRFYKFGFALLPFLWAVNCFYFWPVLRSHSFPRIRPCEFVSLCLTSMHASLLSIIFLIYT